LIEEGDLIRIDIPALKLELLVEDDVLEARRASWQEPELKIKTGYMKRYAQMVQSASTGAVFVK
jgi:dihydroxy-acid dehydratase